MTNNTITLTRSEMQQVLDALEEMKGEIADWGSYASEYFKKKHDLDGSVNRFNPLIETLRARLAQPEQVDEINTSNECVEKEGKYRHITQPEPSVEPVAWIVWNSEGDDEFVNNPNALKNRHYRGGDPMPVYIAPPQREWVRLTDEEISDIPVYSWGTTKDMVRAIETKLKEKNT